MRSASFLHPRIAYAAPGKAERSRHWMARGIDYGNLMHRAMRGLIHDRAEGCGQKRGLPGAHHFFITFDTTAPGVEMADWLRARYPGEMTVVIQHWFDDLQVTDMGFAITLNFGNNPERLVDPVRFSAHLCRPFGRIRPAVRNS